MKLFMSLLIIGVCITGCTTKEYVARQIEPVYKKLDVLEKRLNHRCCVEKGINPYIDMDSDNKVSKNEFKQFIDKSFDVLSNEIDTGGDGLISRDEFINHRRVTFENIIQTLDANGDGLITREEFVQFRAGHKFYKIFMRMNANQDYIVNKDEFDQYQSDDFTIIVKNQDTNRDDRISRDEYVQYYEKEFIRADTNRNGFIDDKEYRRKTLEKIREVANRLEVANGLVTRGYNARDWVHLCPGQEEIGPFCPKIIQIGPSWGGEWPPDRPTCITDPWHPDFDPWAHCNSCFPWC